MKNIILFMVLILVGACGESPSEKIANLMHAPMMEKPFQKTENPDKDFLVNMIPHHKGAVVSSEEFLKVGKNPEALALARNIIVAQNKEIDEFDVYIQSLDQGAISYSQEKVALVSEESQKIMQAMMKKMSTVEMTGEVDVDYLNSMIPHHQGAIDVSTVILSITTNQRIKDIATKIIADQEREIAEIQGILANIKKK